MRKWAERFVTFDTETTGLGPEARVIEFGAAVYEEGKYVAGCSILLNPGDIDLHDPRVAEALSKNHIDPAQLKDCPSFSTEFTHIQNWLSQADVRLAHNTPFDLRMLNQEVKRAMAAGTLRLPPKDPNAAKHTTLNTLALDRHLRPGPSFWAFRRNLAATCERWNVPRQGNHRAQGDAIDCANLLLAFGDALPANLHEVKRVNDECEKEWEDTMRRKYGNR